MNRAKRLLISMIALLCCTGVWASSIPGALSGRFTINASGEKVVFQGTHKVMPGDEVVPAAPEEKN